VGRLGATAPLDLEPIRAREAAATPGPWTEGTLSFREWRMSRNNIVFAARARTDIPALLAEVERLREENEELRAARP
jgi:hypothetical protein